MVKNTVIGDTPRGRRVLDASRRSCDGRHVVSEVATSEIP